MKKFKEFTIKDIFDVSTGSLAPSGTLIPGVVPRVAASSLSNGIIGFYGDVSGLTYVEDVVTISFLGDSFYHKGRVSLEMKVHSLFNNRMTGNSGLYVSGVLSKLKKYYSYGSQLSSSKLKKLKIELPTTSEGAPDWDYMDKYIESIKVKFIESKIAYKDSLKEKLESLLENKQKYELEEVEFGEFNVRSFMEISPTKAYRLGDSEILSIKGNVPFITTTASNNGTVGYTGLKANNLGMCITASDTTVAEAMFFQEIDFVGRSHVQALRLKEGIMSRGVGEYLVTAMIKSAGDRFSYGSKFNRESMYALNLVLPMTDKGTPNWDYMDKYIHNIKIDKVNTIISELESEIEDLSRL